MATVNNGSPVMMTSINTRHHLSATKKIAPKIPDGMVELMKNLAKSVLKEQPENIYEFAARYFENLVRERDGMLDKSYSKFRSVEEEIRKKIELEGCSRCRILPKNEMKIETMAAAEKATEISVKGVAIKAVPRDSKVAKGQKVRQRLETIRSVSMESAASGDNVASDSTSKSSANEKSPRNLTGDSNESDQTDPGLASPRSLDTLNAIDEEHDDLADEKTDSLSHRKMDDDILDTPTADTISMSEANTDKTVIENLSDAQNDVFIMDKVNDQLANDVLSDCKAEVESANGDKKYADEDNMTTNVMTKHAQLYSLKVDRINTPESEFDSGLSEKSFNLNIQENEEAHVNEKNVIKTNTLECAGESGKSVVEQFQSSDNERDAFDVNTNAENGSGRSAEPGYAESCDEQVVQTDNLEPTISVKQNKNESTEESRLGVMKEVTGKTNNDPAGHIEPIAEAEREMQSIGAKSQLQLNAGTVDEQNLIEQKTETVVRSIESGKEGNITCDKVADNRKDQERLADENDPKKIEVISAPSDNKDDLGAEATLPTPKTIEYAGEVAGNDKTESKTTAESHGDIELNGKEMNRDENANAVGDDRNENDEKHLEVNLMHSNENEEEQLMAQADLPNYTQDIAAAIIPENVSTENKAIDSIGPTDQTVTEDSIDSMLENKISAENDAPLENSISAKMIMAESISPESHSNGLQKNDVKAEPSITPEVQPNVSTISINAENVTEVAECGGQENTSAHEKLRVVSSARRAIGFMADMVRIGSAEKDIPATETENMQISHSTELGGHSVAKNVIAVGSPNDGIGGDSENDGNANSTVNQPDGQNDTRSKEHPNAESLEPIDSSDGTIPSGWDAKLDSKSMPADKNQGGSDDATIALTSDSITTELRSAQSDKLNDKDGTFVAEIAGSDNTQKEAIPGNQATAMPSHDNKWENAAEDVAEFVSEIDANQKEFAPYTVTESMEAHNGVNHAPVDSGTASIELHVSAIPTPKDSNLPDGKQANEAEPFGIHDISVIQIESHDETNTDSIKTSQEKCIYGITERKNNVKSPPEPLQTVSQSQQEISGPNQPIIENRSDPIKDTANKNIQDAPEKNDSSSPIESSKTTSVHKDEEKTDEPQKEEMIRNTSVVADEISSSQKKVDKAQSKKSTTEEASDTEGNNKDGAEDVQKTEIESHEASQNKGNLGNEPEENKEVLIESETQRLGLGSSVWTTDNKEIPLELASGILVLGQEKGKQEHLEPSIIIPIGKESEATKIIIRSTGLADIIVDNQQEYKETVEKTDLMEKTEDIQPDSLELLEPSTIRSAIEVRISSPTTIKSVANIQKQLNDEGNENSSKLSAPLTEENNAVSIGTDSSLSSDQIKRCSFPNDSPLKNAHQIENDSTAMDAALVVQYYDTIAFVIINSIEMATSDILGQGSIANLYSQPSSSTDVEQDSNSIELKNDTSAELSSAMHTAAEISDIGDRHVVQITESSHQVRNKSRDYLKPIQHVSNDTPSSDFSDTDLSEKPEKVFNESGVDESSRDERDEASEIENFDVSSCGEDSLEAMYYMLRKNEIIMDKSRTTSTKCGDDEKISFPEKSTENLKSIFREVSGKKASCPMGSMHSSVDDVVLKQMSSDSDGIQFHVMTNSELERSDQLCTRCSITDTTDDEGSNSNANAAQSDCKQDEENESIDIVKRHKMFTTSISDADSDYMPHSNSKACLLRDSFNISTAYEHLTNSESTDLESAATRIQASARGYLTRIRLKKSNTSADNYASLPIDNSLDSSAEQQESASESGNGNEQQITKSSITSHKVRGVTDIKCEHRVSLPCDNTHIMIEENSMDDATQSLDNNDSSTDTAQRRLTLQRGDAMQRYSTPELELKCAHKSNESIEVTKNAAKNLKQSASKSTEKAIVRVLGPRQRSMPVQIESFLLRVLPKQARKRIQSARSTSTKNGQQPKSSQKHKFF